MKRNAIHLLCSVLLLLATALPVRGQNPILRGVVSSSSGGSPIEGVTVQLFDAGDRMVRDVRTDSLGSFFFQLTQPGSYRLLVSGGPPELTESRMIAIRAGDELVVDIRLDNVYQLQGLTVHAARPMVTQRVLDFHERAEFNKAQGRGRVYTREDLERIRPRNAETLVSGIPTSRCDPQIRLDGSPASRADLRSITMENLEGVEVYIGQQIPHELEERGVCGLVLVWTRSQPEGMRRMGIGRLLIGILVGAATFLVGR